MSDNIFTASNGWFINEHGHLADAHGVNFVAASSVESVRRLFLEERDAELGRWRDPEFSEWVCYPDGPDGVLVLNEKSVTTCVWTRMAAAESFKGEITGEDIAARYFDAHPQHKPLPTEPGLYVGNTLRNEPWAARIYRLWDGEWSDVAYPARDTEAVLAAAKRLHEDNGLVRLVAEREDDSQ